MFPPSLPTPPNMSQHFFLLPFLCSFHIPVCLSWQGILGRASSFPQLYQCPWSTSFRTEKQGREAIKPQRADHEGQRVECAISARLDSTHGEPWCSCPPLMTPSSLPPTQQVRQACLHCDGTVHTGKVDLLPCVSPHSPAILFPKLCNNPCPAINQMFLTCMALGPQINIQETYGLEPFKVEESTRRVFQNQRFRVCKEYSLVRLNNPTIEWCSNEMRSLQLSPNAHLSVQTPGLESPTVSISVLRLGPGVSPKGPRYTLGLHAVVC